MMKFAIPALEIYLANPLLSNIDHAFVGKDVLLDMDFSLESDSFADTGTDTKKVAKVIAEIKRAKR
jgi:hypothetical protein